MRSLHQPLEELALEEQGSTWELSAKGPIDACSTRECSARRPKQTLAFLGLNRQFDLPAPFANYGILCVAGRNAHTDSDANRGTASRRGDGRAHLLSPYLGLGLGLGAAGLGLGRGLGARAYSLWNEDGYIREDKTNLFGAHGNNQCLDDGSVSFVFN